MCNIGEIESAAIAARDTYACHHTIGPGHFIVQRQTAFQVAILGYFYGGIESADLNECLAGYQTLIYMHDFIGDPESERVSWYDPVAMLSQYSPQFIDYAASANGPNAP